MSFVCLNFGIVCECEEESAKNLCRDLSLFLQESWFNGEDVLEVKCKGVEVL